MTKNLNTDQSLLEYLGTQDMVQTLQQLQSVRDTVTGMTTDLERLEEALPTEGQIDVIRDASEAAGVLISMLKELDELIPSDDQVQLIHEASEAAGVLVATLRQAQELQEEVAAQA